MRKPNKHEVMRARGALGLKKRYQERIKIVEELHAFGGIQPNYRLWTTKHLKILLKAWQK